MIAAKKKKNAPPPARVQVTTVGAAAADPAHPINIAPPPEDPPIPGTTRPAYGNDNNGTARIDPVYDQPGDLFSGGASYDLATLSVTPSAFSAARDRSGGGARH